MKILLVDDDEHIIKLLCPVLIRQNYTVEIAMDGQMGLDMLANVPCSLILLDVMMPKLNGIQFCQRLRAQKDETPVLMMTARDTSMDKVLGLDAGADDYIVKPVDIDELIARIRALLRRGTTIPPLLQWGRLQFNPSTCEISYAGLPLHLRPKELAIMELLLRQKHRVLSRQMILDHLWSLEDCPDDNTIKAHIRGIRRALESVGAGDLIETLYGKGYRLNAAYLEHPIAPMEPDASLAQGSSLVIAEAWQQVQHLTWQRLQALNQSVQILKQQPANQAIRQQAETLAHQLAGILGFYGLEVGSRVAKQLEQYLQQHRNQNLSSLDLERPDVLDGRDFNMQTLNSDLLELWMLALYQAICPALKPISENVVASAAVMSSTKPQRAIQLVQG